MVEFIEFVVGLDNGDAHMGGIENSYQAVVVVVVLRQGGFQLNPVGDVTDAGFQTLKTLLFVMAKGRNSTWVIWLSALMIRKENGLMVLPLLAI